MSLRTPSVTLVLTLASGVFAAGATAEAQQPGNEGNLYQVQRGERFDDWTLQGFRDLDADGNGRITAAEWSYDREDFRRADHNRDGILTQREFLGEAANDADRRRAAPRSRRTTRASSIWTPTATIACRAANGAAIASPSIGWTRTATAISPAPRWPLPTPSAVDFSSLDTDRNGVISRGEWLQSAASFERLDTNHDGRLTSIEYAGRAGWDDGRWRDAAERGLSRRLRAGDGGGPHRRPRGPRPQPGLGPRRPA